MPDFRSFFQAGNLLWLAATMALVKVLHELGHLLACKHFGAECHELGLMFLLFTPSLYCDVSDAWTLPTKWQRIAVSAAGVYVEVFVAAVCTFVWWSSEPGLLNSLCLNVMFICSVSTLVFNGNPLMRFDGYYVLSDLLEVPNLQTRSRSALSRLLTRWSLGRELAGPGMAAGDRPTLLVCYALAAIANRWLVVVGTFFFLHAVLKPHRLESLAYAFMFVAVLGMLAAPVWRGSQLLVNPLWRRRIRRGRVFVLVCLGAALVAAIVLLPLPCRVQAPSVTAGRCSSGLRCRTGDAPGSALCGDGGRARGDSGLRRRLGHRAGDRETEQRAAAAAVPHPVPGNGAWGGSAGRRAAAFRPQTVGGIGRTTSRTAPTGEAAHADGAGRRDGHRMRRV